MLRRTWVLVVFWSVFTAAIAMWAAGIEGAYVFAALLVALYTVVRHRSWRHVTAASAAVATVVGTGFWQGDLSVPDLGTLGSAFAVTVLLGVTVRTRAAYQAERRRQAVTAERERIAREVHDIVAHNLTVMVALADGAALDAAAQGVPAGAGRAVDALGLIAGAGRQALDEMQRLVGSLATGVRPQPGLSDLDELVEQVRAAGLTVALDRPGPPRSRNAGAELVLYRVVQEALTNTLKHAGPGASALVRLWFADGQVQVDVCDNGRSSPTLETRGRPGGRGLAGMTERVQAHGGTVQAGPTGSGWRVHAALPFTEDGERARPAG